MSPALAPLPARTHRALTVVALAGSASNLTVPVTLPLLGLELTDLDPAITGDILARDGWRFRHPLFAAAVVDHLGPDEVRRTHAALAAVLRGTNVIRHAHHLAAAAGGIDEAAAGALQDAAQLASAGAASPPQRNSGMKRPNYHHPAQPESPGSSRQSRRRPRPASEN